MSMTDYETMTQYEWIAKGTELFGKNMSLWQFKCPICGNIQCAEDFRKFKEQGATPDTVRKECIGRYLPKEKVTCAFGNKNSKIKSPCDYAVYGLFRMGHKIKLDNGDETFAFPFAEIILNNN